jgi:hypothetical protein
VLGQIRVEREEVRPKKTTAKKACGLFHIIPCMVDNLTFYGCTLGLEGTTVSTTSLQGGHLRYRVLHTKQSILTPRFTLDGCGPNRQITSGFKT